MVVVGAVADVGGPVAAGEGGPVGGLVLADADQFGEDRGRDLRGELE